MNTDKEFRSLLDKYKMPHPPGQTISKLSVRMTDWQWYAVTDLGQFTANADHKKGEWLRLMHPQPSWEDLPV